MIRCELQIFPADKDRDILELWQRRIGRTWVSALDPTGLVAVRNTSATYAVQRSFSIDEQHRIHHHLIML